jgi:hypothetical protein
MIVEVKQALGAIERIFTWIFGSWDPKVKLIDRKAETYIRPFRKSVFLYFKGYAVFALMVFIMSKVMIPILTIGHIDPLTEIRWFGTVHVSTSFFIMLVLTPVGLIFSTLFMLPNWFCKYELELNANLIPTHNGDVLYRPEKINNQEPIWIPNYEFDTTIKIIDAEDGAIKTSIGSLFKVCDEMLPDNFYLLQDKDLSKYFNAFSNGRLMGKFTFQKYVGKYSRFVYLKVLEVQPISAIL